MDKRRKFRSFFEGKKKKNKESSHYFEELEEKELNDTLSEEDRANLEEERDLIENRHWDKTILG